jgi:hypothetical protein
MNEIKLLKSLYLYIWEGESWVSVLHKLVNFSKIKKNGTHSCKISLMKQQFVVTHQYTILQETEKTWPILNRAKT